MTLHPQSAVEHLHHLFVAAGGEGSDAVLAVEATELRRPRGSHRPQSPADGDAFGELRRHPGGARRVAAGSGPCGDRAGGRGCMPGITGAIGERVDRIIDLMPQARAPHRVASRRRFRGAKRSAAAPIAILAFVAVIVVLGRGRGGLPAAPGAHAGRRRRCAVRLQLRHGQDQPGLRAGGLLAGGDRPGDPVAALRLHRSATANDGRRLDRGDALQARITAGLDPLYNAHHSPRSWLRFRRAPSRRPWRTVRSRTNALYYIDGRRASAAWTRRASTPAAKVVVKTGDGSAQGDGVAAPARCRWPGPAHRRHQRRPVELAAI